MNEYIKDKTNNIDFKFYKFRNENRKIELQHLLIKLKSFSIHDRDLILVSFPKFSLKFL